MTMQLLGANAPHARARAWGRIDRLLVDQVAAIPWYWDAQANIESANVKGVIAEWNATWDLTFSSVE